MNVIVQYGDVNGKTRWGYLTMDGFNKLQSSMKIRRDIAMDKEKGIVDEEKQKQLNDLLGQRIIVYLPDGTTGDGTVRDVEPVMPFAEMQMQPPQMPQRPSRPEIEKEPDSNVLRINPSRARPVEAKEVVDMSKSQVQLELFKTEKAEEPQNAK
jgi:hypothetical protein